MDRDWLARALVATQSDGPATVLQRLCHAAVEPLGVSGVAVVVLSGGEPRGTVGATDEVAKRLEDLQFTLGEGPCLDVYNGRVPVVEANLAEAQRWPAFARAAGDAGVTAVFAFPLQVGAARFGALALHRRQHPSLGDVPIGDAAVVAEAATNLLLALLADVPPGALPRVLEDVSTQRARVFQATGMVSAQLGSSVETALIRLRASAFAEGRNLGDVAADVVARRRRFD